MDEMKKTIESYLSDKTMMKVYEDLYKELKGDEYDSDIIPYAAPEDPKEFVKKFIGKIQNTLRQKICIEWDYIAKKTKFKTLLDLILSLASYYLETVHNFHTPRVVPQLITVLVMDGYLDKLCADCKQD